MWSQSQWQNVQMYDGSSKNNLNVKDMRWTGWKQPERVLQVKQRQNVSVKQKKWLMKVPYLNYTILV